jgi:5-methyltetrahydrofolate--homocysteine methyltransferase
LAREVADEFTSQNPDKSMDQNSKHVTRCKRSRIQSRNFDDLRIAYKQQEALMDGGCDLLLVETILIPKCQSSAFAIEEVKEERNLDIPIMVSGTITDASGRTLSGQTVEAFLVSVFTYRC